MKTRVAICSFVFVANVATAQVPDPVEFNDQFSYTTAAALSGQGPWAAIGTGTSTIFVVSGNQIYSGYSQSIGAQVELSATSGNKASRRTLSAPRSADIIYAYFLVNFSAAPTGTEMFLALRNASGVADDGMDLPGSRPLKVSARAGAGGTIELGIRKKGGPRAFASSKLLSIGTTYLVVASYSFIPGSSNDQVRLWINPTTFPGLSGEPAPDASTSSGNDGVQITGVTLRESSAGGSLRLDDLTVKHVDPALPVELVSLEASSDGSSAIIRWTTNSENGSAGFVVEREIGNDFAAIGFVPGAGTSNELSSYSFEATDLAPGVHRFRLRQMDAFGSSAISSIVESSIKVQGSYQLDQPYPNPFVEAANVGFAVSEAGPVSLRLYDMLGREVQVVHDGDVASDAVVRANIDGTNLATGTYMLRLIGADFSATRFITRR